MASRDPSTTPDERRRSGSATDSPGKDGLDRVELSDLDSSPPQLPVEQDLMQLARLGELRGIQKLFDSGRYNAKSTDEQGITALHVRSERIRARRDVNSRLMYTFSPVGCYQRTSRAVPFSHSVWSQCQCERRRCRGHTRPLGQQKMSPANHSAASGAWCRPFDSR